MKIAGMSAALPAALIAGLCLVAPVAAAAESPWIALGGGLELGRFPLAGFGAPPAQVHVLRVDPRRWELTLHGLPSGESVGYTAREWSRREGLVAAINAGMYQADYRTHSGYMRADGTVFSRGTNGYLSAAAFDPVDPKDPPFRMFDLDDDPLASVLAALSPRRPEPAAGQAPRREPVVAPGAALERGGPRRGPGGAGAADLLRGAAAPRPAGRGAALAAAWSRGGAAPRGRLAGAVLRRRRRADGSSWSAGTRGSSPRPTRIGPAWPIPNVIGVRARARGGRRTIRPLDGSDGLAVASGASSDVTPVTRRLPRRFAPRSATHASSVHSAVSQVQSPRG